MATDAEAIAAGFALPKGADLIKNGDDAITQNAKATVDLKVDQDQKIDRLNRANRTALHQLSMPSNNDLNDTAPSRHVRVPVKFFATINRWELVLKNFNDRTSRNYGRLSFVNVYIGERAKDAEGNYTANYATGTRVDLGSPSLAGAGTDAERYVIYDLTYPLEANKEYIIGYAFTHTNTASHMGIGGSYLGTNTTAVTSYDATNTWSPNTPLDVYIKPQISSDIPFYVYPGSSSETGSGSDYPLRDVWAWRHAEAHKAVPALIGQSGSMLSTWVGSFNYIRSKFSTIARADKVIGNPASNDIYSGETLASVKTLFVDFAKWVRRNLGDTFEAVDVFPRSTETAAVAAVRLGFNQYLYGLPEDILQCHVRSEAVLNSAGLLDQKYNSGDNTHLNSLGQHTITAAILSGRPRPDLPLNRYTIDQSAGRVVKVWDYVNNRDHIIYGDTGARALPVDKGVSTWVRRTGNTVSLEMQGSAVGSGDIDFSSIPAGFRPNKNQVIPVHSGASGYLRGLLLSYSPYPLRVYGINPATPYLNVTATWVTPDTWPTVLPGTAVGSIPA